jgi:hypothetical protein
MAIRRPAVPKLAGKDPNRIYHWLVGQPAKVPYRWHELAARPNDPVEYCEGEADADKMAELGFLATTVAGQNWSETAVEAFKGRDVSIWEHNDTAGRENSAGPHQGGFDSCTRRDAGHGRQTAS